MKRLFLIALISIFAFAGSAQFASADQGDMYAGVKVGLIAVDDVDDEGIDDITALGFLVGFGLTPEVSVEGEFNIGLSGGDMDIDEVPGVLTADGEVDVWTFGAYAVYRHPILDNVSLKGKAGFVFESVDVDLSGTLGGVPFDFSEDDTSFEASYGVGATIGLTDQISAEVEYTFLESDIGYLSAGLNFKF